MIVYSIEYASSYFVLVFDVIKLLLRIFYGLLQVDPFLQLFNDSQLQAVMDTIRQPSKVYGSKEDDEDALKSLSAIKLTESQSKESFATMIVQSLGKSSNVITRYHALH